MLLKVTIILLWLCKFSWENYRKTVVFISFINPFVLKCLSMALQICKCQSVFFYFLKTFQVSRCFQQYFIGVPASNSFIHLFAWIAFLHLNQDIFNNFFWIGRFNPSIFLGLALGVSSLIKFNVSVVELSRISSILFV